MTLFSRLTVKLRCMRLVAIAFDPVVIGPDRIGSSTKRVWILNPGVTFLKLSSHKHGAKLGLKSALNDDQQVAIRHLWCDGQQYWPEHWCNVHVRDPPAQMCP